MNPTRTKIALTDITKFINISTFKLKIDVYKQFPQYALDLDKLLNYLEYTSSIVEIIKLPEKDLYYYHVPVEFRNLSIERLKTAVLKAQEGDLNNGTK